MGPTRLLRAPRPAPVLAALVAWIGAASCDPAATPSAAPTPTPWPAGTVLALDGSPIRAEEVDEVAARIAVIEPGYEVPHLRRLALTNVVLPRLAAIHLGADRRDRARERMDQCHALLAAGADVPAPYTGFRLEEREGGYGDVGMECFDWALTGEIGRWSPVHETIGAFEAYKVEERSTAATPKKTRVRVTVCYVPYLDPTDWHDQVDKKLDRSKLVFVDESWRDLVPEIWKHRLRGETP